MKKEIIVSKDGSQTLSIPEMDETYHSINGALTESQHVFIDMGIDKLPKGQKEIKIFEVGFGTGLNAMTTIDWLKTNPSKQIIYHTIEAFPVDKGIIEKLNYADLFTFKDSVELYNKIHEIKWNQEISLSSQFKIAKFHNKLEDFKLESNYYDCIYFDAFAPNKQGEMWEMDILRKCHEALAIHGRFVTYCAKGQLKRDLKTLGFEVVMVPGPPGKREMTTAIKKQPYKL